MKGYGFKVVPDDSGETYSVLDAYTGDEVYSATTNADAWAAVARLSNARHQS